MFGSMLEWSSEIADFMVSKKDPKNKDYQLRACPKASSWPSLIIRLMVWTLTAWL